jgi:hypothetical protein
MDSIGIVGSGIAAVHLALRLQQHSVPLRLYSDRTPSEIRAGRLPNTVVRFDPTRNCERALGVEHWDSPEIGMFGVHMSITGTPIAFRGDFSHPASFVDMRIYQAALLDDYTARGGDLQIGTVRPEDLNRIAGRHEVVVVASGRGRLSDCFPVLPDRSPYAMPQRRLCAGLFHGIRPLDPLGLTITFSPGHGELFCGTFHSFDGLVGNVLIEAIPGGALEPITMMRYEENPRRYSTALLAVLEEHAPPIYERVCPNEFGLVRPLDLHRGAITPAARQGHIQLDNGRYAIAIGDAHVQNDPVLGQGANAACHAAQVLSEAILNEGPFDEEFCRRVEETIWNYTGPVTEWSNAALQPPPPHVNAVFEAASRNQAIANEVIENFAAPARNWAIFGSPEGATEFLTRHGESVEFDRASEAI